MAKYDSDSSGDEEDYAETNVLLGYPSLEPNGETTSRVGGRAEWLDSDSRPSAALARCKICKDLLVLLLQLNGELPDRFPNHDRRLYVFSCKRKSCRRKEGSIRALRGVRITGDDTALKNTGKESEAPKQQAPAVTAAVSTGVGEALFGVKVPTGSSSANPFSTSSSANPFASSASAAPTNPFGKRTEPASPPKTEELVKELPKTFAETLSLNNTQQASGPPPPPEPWPPEDEQPAPYPVAWLADAEYETLDKIPLPDVAKSTPMEIDAGEGSGSSGKEDKAVFESSMDTAFQKFADRVGQNPEQCIRYEFGGQPLLYSKSDPVGKLFDSTGDGGASVKVVGGKGIPRCQNCGAGRVFEVQLTPYTIGQLERDEDGLDGMEWGTIIVGVCEKDCQERGKGSGEAGYLEEWAGVQWEEQLAMKK